MWSDPLPPERLRALVGSLHSVLPAPSPAASPGTCTLRGQPSPDQLAELLQRDPGFAWINGSAGPLLLHRPLATIAYSDGCALVSGPGGARELSGRGFDLLEAMLSAWQNAPAAILAGFLSYDLAAELEDLGPAPLPRFRFPCFFFGLFDAALLFQDDAWTLSSSIAWREPISAAAAEELLGRAQTLDIPEPPPLSIPGPITSRPSRAGFEASVARTVATIHAGDIFQTNLCRALETALPAGAEWNLYRRLRAISPARYEAFLRLPEDRAVLSISPELFLKVENGFVQSDPIKGTRPRGDSAAEDRALAAQLSTSEKDRAELAMIVDVVRNDLARVCEPGSVEVVHHAALMTLPTVHHLYSTVRGRLRKTAGLVDLLRAAFPAASISGAPKIEAMRVALREEAQARGPCMGAIGAISLDGRLELSVAIRTAFAAGGTVRYYAGCGITAESVPAQEFQESNHKAAAFLRALDPSH